MRSTRRLPRQVNEPNHYSDFWRKRSERYNALEWANHQALFDRYEDGDIGR